MPSKKCENSDSEDKPDESENEKIDKSIARCNWVKHCHAVQAMHEKECRLEENIRKQAIRGDHSYCRERNNAPAERIELVLTEVEWQRRESINASQSGGSGVPCEVHWKVDCYILDKLCIVLMFL